MKITKRRKITYLILFSVFAGGLWLGLKQLEHNRESRPLAIGVDGDYTTKKRMSKTQIKRLEKHMLDLPPAIQPGSPGGGVHSQVEMVNSINQFNQQQTKNK